MTTTKWTIKSANEYLQNVMTEANIEHNYEIAMAKEYSKNIYFIKEKKTGYNVMSWSWDTLRQLMNAIEKDKARFVEAMKQRMDELNAA